MNTVAEVDRIAEVWLTLLFSAGRQDLQEGHGATPDTASSKVFAHCTIQSAIADNSKYQFMHLSTVRSHCFHFLTFISGSLQALIR